MSQCHEPACFSTNYLLTQQCMTLKSVPTYEIYSINNINVNRTYIYLKDCCRCFAWSNPFADISCLPFIFIRCEKSTVSRWQIATNWTPLISLQWSLKMQTMWKALSRERNSLHIIQFMPLIYQKVLKAFTGIGMYWEQDV